MSDFPGESLRKGMFSLLSLFQGLSLQLETVMALMGVMFTM